MNDPLGKSIPTDNNISKQLWLNIINLSIPVVFSVENRLIGQALKRILEAKIYSDIYI